LKTNENASDVKVFYVDEANDKVVQVPTTYDTAKGCVVFSTDHFSYWYVDVIPEPPSGGDDEGGFPVWAIILIVVAVIAIAGGVGAYLFVKKKGAQ
jgi:hypothetical protein